MTIMNSKAQPSSQNKTSYADLITPDHSGQQWSDLDTNDIKERFKEHGALLFRGFEGDLNKLSTFTDRFCQNFFNNPTLGRNTVSKKDNVQTVNTGDTVFALHSERSQTPIAPDICWFYCNVAPETLGETTYCDGELLVSTLPDDLREFLANKNIHHGQRIPLNHLMVMLETDDPNHIDTLLEQKGFSDNFAIEGEFVKVNYSFPALRNSRYRDKPAFANFLLFNRYMHNMKVQPTFGNGELISDEICERISRCAEKITIYHKWQKSDLLMLDNTRFMHGRNAIADESKRDIWTRFGNAGF